MEIQHKPLTTGQWSLGISGVAIAALGFVGWMQVSPPLPIPEALYRALTLLALQYDYPIDRTPPLLLNWARFLALLWAATAVWAVVGRVFGSRLRSWRAKAATNHVVLAGSGPEVPELALRYRRANPSAGVIVLGEVEQQQALQLRRAGVVLLPGATHQELVRIVRGAARIVVADRSDAEAARLASQIEFAAGADPFPSVVMFDNPDLSRQWNRDRAPTALCRNTQLAIALLRTSPPLLEDHATPPPVVISEGALGSQIVSRIVVGWQQPGERLIVHCFGSGSDWVDEVTDTLGHRCELTIDRIPRGVDAVPEIVQNRVATWQAPDKREASPSGPTVIVAVADPTVGVPLAIALADQMIEARVSVMVDDASIWARRLAALPRPPRLVSRLDHLAEPAVLELTPERLLRDELFADHARWPPEIPSILGGLTRDPTGHVLPLDNQPLAVRQAIEAIAASAHAVLAEGNLETSARSTGPAESPLLSPSELVAMADKLMAALPAAASDAPDVLERRLRALEMASRLPTLVARAGWAPRRPAGYNEALPTTMVAGLAQRAHEVYLQVAERTSNATGSDAAAQTWADLPAFKQASSRAQVVDMPLKLAAMGYDWRPAGVPTLVELPDAEIELLAELEHRRWSFHQRSNGCPEHELMGPWAALPDQRREYDREPVRCIPAALASVGLEIVKSTPQPHP